MADPIRPLWDFDDLDATEGRFRALLAEEASERGRADVTTQLARIEGLRGRFDDGDRLLDEATALAGPSARVQLERGRLRRSGGDRVAALPLFEAAFAAALEEGDEFLAADAAHMVALAAPDRESMVAWTARGVELAEESADPETAYWLGPLLNNLGWAHFGAADFEAALDAFERALEARERDPGKPYEIEIARYAVAKTLLALGRPAEGAERLEQAVAWSRAAGKPDGWFHEELAEAYAALGRVDDAREQARLALPLLRAADRSFEGDPTRSERLRRLAGDA
jgi:tetratricopeptide (TPR) repeat protein